MFKRFWSFMLSLLLMARTFVSEAVKPAVNAVKQVKDAILDKEQDVVTLLTANLGYKKRDLDLFAESINSVFPQNKSKTAEKSEQTIRRFVDEIRELTPKWQNLLLFALATEYAVSLKKDHGYQDYQVSTLVQLYYTAQKEKAPLVNRF